MVVNTLVQDHDSAVVMAGYLVYHLKGTVQREFLTTIVINGSPGHNIHAEKRFLILSNIVVLHIQT
jgi:hypothetical protein